METCPRNASLQVTVEAPWIHLATVWGPLKSWACRGKHSFLSAIRTELLLGHSDPESGGLSTLKGWVNGF